MSEAFSWVVEIIDISEGGACIASPLQPSVGSEVDLRFLHPDDSREVATRGVVRYEGLRLSSDSDAYAIGVEFAA